MTAAPASARQGDSLESSDKRCFTVSVDGQGFGLPVEAIQTVFEMTAITPVPLAPYEVLGLVNLRGKIATAVSLRRRLGLDEDGDIQTKLAVGIDHRDESFALVVDEVGDVLMLDRGTQIELPPHLNADGARFSSVHRLKDKILTVLDLDWALGMQDRGQDIVLQVVPESPL